MDTAFHRFQDLFQQLGLPNDAWAIDRFVATHRHRPSGVRLPDAAFWTPSQAQFLREALASDADWTAVVDALSARLST